jgi:transaldolase/glucose-6-phosphate isomerase
MTKTNLHRLFDECGQSPWLDNIRRGMLSNGEMQNYIDSGIVGVTANPTIFEKAIGGSNDYDEAIEAMVREGKSVDEIYEGVAIKDIQDACDMFAPVYERTGHVDGRVSLEVLPELANATEGTIAQAAEYWQRVGRPNLLVKIPATAEGVPAIEESIYRGISINVTLIFGLERYREVMNAYMRGLERRIEEGQPVNDIFSVASFFVSRVDTLVDKQLEAELKDATDDAQRAEIKALLGKAGIANAKLAYAEYQQMFSGPRWDALKGQGANVQRPLWASTSTKNPDYPDTLYLDALIGPDTVDTMPPQSIVAFLDHGKVARTLDADLDQAHEDMRRLAAVGIDMDQVTEQLEVEGVKSFSESFTKLRESISGKRDALLVGHVAAGTRSAS